MIIRASGDGLKDEEDDHAFQKLVGDVQRLRQELATAEADLNTAITSASADLTTHAAATGTAVHGLGTMSTQNANAVAVTGGTIANITDLAVADGGTGASTAANARTNLGLVIGTDVQAYDAELGALASTTSAADALPYFTGLGTATTTTLTAFGRSLAASADALAGRGVLGLGSLATASSLAFSALSDVTITSLANLNFPRYDTGTSKWVNTSLGSISYAAAGGGALQRLALDGGASAAAGSIVMVSNTASRMLMSGIGTFVPLDFKLSGDADIGTDICARIRTISATQVSFFDQATPSSNGTEVLRWGTNSVAANRYFSVYAPVTMSDTLYVTGSLTTAANLTVSGAGTDTFSATAITASSAVSVTLGSFRFVTSAPTTTIKYGNDSFLQYYSTGSGTGTVYTFTNLDLPNSKYVGWGATSGAAPTTYITGNTGTGINIASASPNYITLTSGLNYLNGPSKIGGATTDVIGFYGAVGATKPTVTGARGGNAALTSLMTALASLGLVVNSTT